MWRSYWSNTGSKDARPLDVTRRIALLDKAVTPQLDFRLSRWPPQKTIANEVDGLQRKMVASAMRIPRYPGEDAADFVRRRGRAAALQCRQSGQWSQRWFKRATDWNKHLERPHNSDSWPAKLLHYRAREWLIQRRIPPLPANGRSSSCLAGRTGTRSSAGCVHARWHDGIELARGCSIFRMHFDQGFWRLPSPSLPVLSPSCLSGPSSCVWRCVFPLVFVPVPCLASLSLCLGSCCDLSLSVCF